MWLTGRELNASMNHKNAKTWEDSGRDWQRAITQGRNTREEIQREKQGAAATHKHGTVGGAVGLQRSSKSIMTTSFQTILDNKTRVEPISVPLIRFKGGQRGNASESIPFILPFHFHQKRDPQITTTRANRGGTIWMHKGPAGRWLLPDYSIFNLFL